MKLYGRFIWSLFLKPIQFSELKKNVFNKLNGITHEINRAELKLIAEIV